MSGLIHIVVKLRINRRLPRAGPLRSAGRKSTKTDNRSPSRRTPGRQYLHPARTGSNKTAATSRSYQASSMAKWLERNSPTGAGLPTEGREATAHQKGPSGTKAGSSCSTRGRRKLRSGGLDKRLPHHSSTDRFPASRSETPRPLPSGHVDLSRARGTNTIADGRDNRCDSSTILRAQVGSTVAILQAIAGASQSRPDS